MKVVVELSLIDKDGLGMGSSKTHENLDISIEEWTKGSGSSREEYLLVRDNHTQEHLFNVRIGTEKQVYIELSNGSIITVRDSG